MADWEAKAKAMRADDDDDGKDVKVLDEGDIALLQTYGLGPYSRRLTELQKTIDKTHEKIKEEVPPHEITRTQKYCTRYSYDVYIREHTRKNPESKLPALATFVYQVTLVRKRNI